MPEPAAEIHDWSALPTDHPMPLIDRQRVVGTHMMISRVVLHKGFEIGTHQHENEQIAVCLEGETVFVVGGPGSERELTVTAGQALVLPPNVPHSARAVETTVFLDLFSPPSEKTGVDA